MSPGFLGSGRVLLRQSHSSEVYNSPQHMTDCDSICVGSVVTC